MSELEQNETIRPGLPLVLEAALPRPSLVRNAARAEFVSQLLVNRDRMVPKRPRRVGVAEGAVGAYQSGARISERRMPQGYRKSLVV